MAFISEIGGIIKSKLTSSQARDLRFQVPDIVAEQRRISHFRRLYDYYIFNRERVLSHLQAAMKVTFKPDTLRSMQFPLYNLTKKIINQTSVAYLIPAERYTLEESDNEVYQEILENSNINSASKTWNRMAKLLDTVYVGVSLRDGKIEYEVHPPHGLTVREDPNNYLEAEYLSYERAFGKETYEVVWTREEHRILDKDGRMVEGLNPWAGVNRYGLIPYIPCRLSVPDDHWGEGDTELVSINEKVNILIASLFHNALLQSHGVAFGVNLNMEKNRGKGDSENPQIQTGPAWMIEVNDVAKDDVLPSLSFLHPDPAIAANIQAVDWLIKTQAVMKGLSAANVSIDPTEASGVSKQVDLAELRERRQDDIEFLRPFEKRLFDVTRMVWNKAGGKKLSDKATFGIDFRELEPVYSQTEQWAVKEKKYQMGLWSPVDDMIDEDEGIDKAKALEFIRENLAIKKELDALRIPKSIKLVMNQPEDMMDDGVAI